MARMTAKLPDELIAKLNRVGKNTDKVCEKALKAGAEVAEKAVASNLSAVVGKGTKYPSRSTGELQKSLGVTPVGIDGKGNYDIKIGFKEPRSDNESNAKLANILEYGKSNQPAKPFLKPAKSKSKNDVLNTIKEVLEKEMENI